MSERTFLLSVYMGSLMLLGCFVDDGSNTAGQETMETTAVTTTTTTGEPTTASSTGATTGPTTNPTTDAPTTDAPTTDSGGPCNGGPQVCEPEDVEFSGEACGTCGEMTRVCADSGCGWSEWYCDGAEECALWQLGEGQDAWTVLRRDDLAGSPPEGVIQVMFSLMYNRKLVVVTASEYYVLDTINLEWAESGPRSDIFPNLGDAVLTSAISINEAKLAGEEPATTENIFLTAAGLYWRYNFNAISFVTTLQDSGSCCAEEEDWQTPSSPSASELAAGWFDHDNTNDWYPVELGVCEEGNGTLGAHSIYFVNDGTVRVRDWMVCGDFVGSIPNEDYAPFTFDGAPLPTVLGAVSYMDGIYAVPTEIMPP